MSDELKDPAPQVPDMPQTPQEPVQGAPEPLVTELTGLDDDDDEPVLTLADARRGWEDALKAPAVLGTGVSLQVKLANLEMFARQVIALSSPSARVPDAKVVAACAVDPGSLVWWHGSGKFLPVIANEAFSPSGRPGGSADHPQHTHARLVFSQGSPERRFMTLRAAEPVIIRGNPQRLNSDAPGLRAVRPCDLEPGMRAAVTDTEILDNLCAGTEQDVVADAAFRNHQFRAVTAVGENSDWMLVRSGVNPQGETSRSGWAAKIDISSKLALSVLEESISQAAREMIPGMQPEGTPVSLNDLQCLIPAEAVRPGMQFRREAAQGSGSWVTVTAEPVAQEGRLVRLFTRESGPVMLPAYEELAVRAFGLPDPGKKFPGRDAIWLSVDVHWLQKGMDIQVARENGKPGAATLTEVDRLPDLRSAPGEDRSVLMLANGLAQVLPGRSVVLVTRESYLHARSFARRNPQEFTHWALEGSLDGDGEGQAACGGDQDFAAELSYEAVQSAVTCPWCRDYLRRREDIERTSPDPVQTQYKPSTDPVSAGDPEPDEEHEPDPDIPHLTQVRLAWDEAHWNTCRECAAAWAADWTERNPDVVLVHRRGIEYCPLEGRQPRPYIAEVCSADDEQVTCEWCRARITAVQAATQEYLEGLQSPQEPVVTGAEYKRDKEYWEGLTAALTAARERERTRSRRLGILVSDMLDGVSGGPSALRVVTREQVRRWEQAWRAAVHYSDQDPATGVIFTFSGSTTQDELHAWVLAPDPSGGEEHLPVARLYLTESEVEHGLWTLDCRMDERGSGSPLVWLSKDEAEKDLRDEAELSGCYGSRRVLEFVLASRLEPPSRCDICGEWGHEGDEHLRG